MNAPATKSQAWPRLKIYRVGQTGYAYNPSCRNWEIYSLNSEGAIDDLLGADYATRDAACERATRIDSLRARNATNPALIALKRECSKGEPIVGVA